MLGAAPVRADRDLERKYPGANRLSTEVVINILRTESLLSARLNRRFREHGLTTGTFDALMAIAAAHRELCPHEIGEALLVTRGTVTGLLDTLEKRGFVSRRPHPEDRRMQLVGITAKGRGTLRAMLPGHFQGEAAMAAGLTIREKQTLIRLLGKLQAGLGP